MRDEMAGGLQAAPAKVLQIDRLSISYAAPGSRIVAVRDFSMEIAGGETVALVGESGCGKTTLALAIPGLLNPGARQDSGRIRFQGKDLSRLSAADWRRIRGPGIGMVFQDPRSALNPVLSIGAHLIETVRAHQKVAAAHAARFSQKILDEVGIPEPELMMKRFPSELSGGMCQRVGIALAICNSPSLLIADEPTSALDATLQARILELLLDLKERRGMALLLISHDLDLVSTQADRVLMMYHGRVIESGPRGCVLCTPVHPYTRALLHSRPQGKQPPAAIPGAPPRPGESFPGCAFAPRCADAQPFCNESIPVLRHISEVHEAACLRIGEIRPAG